MVPDHSNNMEIKESLFGHQWSLNVICKGLGTQNILPKS